MRTCLGWVNLLQQGSLTMLVFLRYITIIDRMLFHMWGVYIYVQDRKAGMGKLP